MSTLQQHRDLQKYLVSSTLDHEFTLVVMGQERKDSPQEEQRVRVIGRRRQLD